jgi:5-(carboxyamino)imidazole ribonucleotide synthase
MTTQPVITPPAMLGILGGGQLGRYFVLAAQRMGYRVTVLEPDRDAPAGKVADVHLVAPYDDPAALATLAETCAVVTVEFENAPAAALETIADRVPVRPSPKAVAITQDRITEKQFLRDLGANVAPYRVIRTEEDLAAASDFEFPAILKTARLGYDGKGQHGVWAESDLPGMWANLGNVPCVLEKKLTLDRELSVVMARTADGKVAHYPVAQNQHIMGILDTSYVPAHLPDGAQEGAWKLCTAIAERLDFVGVLAVEMFVVGKDVYVNELAPRPHNSGHYTLDVCLVSQFEQQVRAVCNLALGDTHMVVPGVAMVNLLGQLWDNGEPKWEHVLDNPAAWLHLYGKKEPREGRKMGHITVASGTAMGSTAVARQLRKKTTAE